MDPKTQRPTILVTNDDGIDSPGIQTLWQALQSVGEVVVVAPDHNWTASGHAKTLHKPLRAERVEIDPEIETWISSGAPSDCVALALLGVVEHNIDLVVSGINRGSNLGQDITYSGTIAAAFEAAIADTPAIAVSLDVPPQQMSKAEQYQVAARVATRLAEEVGRRTLPSHSLLNVNVPAGTPKGIKVTRLGLRFYSDQLVARTDPRGRPYYWIGGERPSGDTQREGTDIWAVANGYISVTPVHLDMTDMAMLDSLKQWDIEALLEGE